MDPDPVFAGQMNGSDFQILRVCEGGSLDLAGYYEHPVKEEAPACFSAPAVHTSFWAQSLLTRPLCLHITNPCRLTLCCKERIKKCGRGKRGELLCREGSPTAVLMSFRDLLYLNEKDCVATGPPLAGIRGQGWRIQANNTSLYPQRMHFSLVIHFIFHLLFFIMVLNCVINERQRNLTDDLISALVRLFGLSFLMKIEGKPCKIVPVDLFSSMHFPPLPYLIYLFTCDSVTDLCPSGAWIHIDKVSHLLQWVVSKEHSHGLPIPFPHSFSPPRIIKEVSMIAMPTKDTDFQQREVCPFICLNTAADFLSLLVMWKG